MKNILLFLILAGIIFGGIGYTVYRAPELPEHRLFDASIRLFAQNSQSIEADLVRQGKITPFDKQLSLEYFDLDGEQSQIAIKMFSVNDQIILQFGEGNTALAKQTILLEPKFAESEADGSVNNIHSGSANSIIWKCIGGSVFIRFRSKNCRLGYGFSRNEILAQK